MNIVPNDILSVSKLFERLISYTTHWSHKSQASHVLKQGKTSDLLLLFQNHVSYNLSSWMDEWCSCLWNASANVEDKHLGCYSMVGANYALMLHRYQNKNPDDPCLLGVPPGASKLFSLPMVRSAQTVHLSCVKISTISKWTKRAST